MMCTEPLPNHKKIKIMGNLVDHFLQNTVWFVDADSDIETTSIHMFIFPKPNCIIIDGEHINFDQMPLLVISFVNGMYVVYTMNDDLNEVPYQIASQSLYIKDKPLELEKGVYNHMIDIVTIFLKEPHVLLALQNLPGISNDFRVKIMQAGFVSPEELVDCHINEDKKLILFSEGLMPGEIEMIQRSAQQYILDQDTPKVDKYPYYLVYLARVGSAKLRTVKEVKIHTGLGLKEAKHLVDEVHAGNHSVLPLTMTEVQAINAVCGIRRCTSAAYVERIDGAEFKPVKMIVNAGSLENMPLQIIRHYEGKDVVPCDNLTVIEGIGPKLQKVLYSHDVYTYLALAEQTEGELRRMLENAGKRYQMHNPTTWPEQAELAAAGRWDELKAWQDNLSYYEEE